jgi:hypothetical protein
MTNVTTLYNVSSNSNALTNPSSIPGRSISIADLTNPNWPRLCRFTPNGTFVGHGGNVVLIDFYSQMLMAVTANPNLTWPPYFTLQPNSVSIVHPNATNIGPAAVSSEIAVTWQWQNGTGGSWANIGSGGVYSNYTTNLLYISNSNTLNGENYRVVAVNSQGSNTSNVATLTVT